MGLIPGSEDPLEWEVATTPVFLPGNFHGQRSLVGYSQWVCRESDMAEYTCILQDDACISTSSHLFP